MRIIAGQWKGRALASVGKGDAGAHLRPTTDRTRESLFSILQGGRFGDPISNARVLDLFAGTGALGLEALSRGAEHATFVDNGRVAKRLLGENIALCGASERAATLGGDARRLPATTNAPFTLIFLDPPYGKNMGRIALENARSDGWIAPDALVVWEEASRQESPSGFTHLDARRFGDTWVTFIRASP